VFTIVVDLLGPHTDHMADQDRYRLQKGGRRGKLPAKRAGGSAGWQMSKADLRNLDSACRGITAPGAAWRGTGTSGWRRLELRKRRRKAASINRDVGRFTLLSHVVDIPAGIYPFHGPDGAAARLAHERLNVTRIETGTAVAARPFVFRAIFCAGESRSSLLPPLPPMLHRLVALRNGDGGREKKCKS
jgi:hypothetical protein